MENCLDQGADWPFADPTNVAVITTINIIKGRKPILLVCHNEELGDWHFLEGGSFHEEEAIVVSLRNITQRDPSLMLLADLPLGWSAWREEPSLPWERGPLP